MLRKRARPERRGLSGRRGARPAGGTAREPRDAFSEAIGWLARRDHATSELAARLAARGHDEASVQSALHALRERGYLDDERFAQQYTAAQVARGHGPVRIRHELASVGLPGTLIDAALAEQGDSSGWARLAADVCRRRFGERPPGGRSEWARRARFLQYRGFSIDHIHRALGDTDLEAVPLPGGPE